MDMNAQAESAVSRLNVELAGLSDDEHRIAKLAWLDGYKAGMEATQALAEAAITQALS